MWTAYLYKAVNRSRGNDDERSRSHPGVTRTHLGCWVQKNLRARRLRHVRKKQAWRASDGSRASCSPLFSSTRGERRTTKWRPCGVRLPYRARVILNQNRGPPCTKKKIIITLCTHLCPLSKHTKVLPLSPLSFFFLSCFFFPSHAFNNDDGVEG